MKNWKLVTVTAAALSALVFAAACTVEEGTVDGEGGSAGTAGSTATAGAAGTTAAAGAAGEAGAAGAAATPQTFADAFNDENDKPSACSTCIATKCTAETTACGDVSSMGKGACGDAVSCLATESADATKSFDCAFETCAVQASSTANADQVNSMFTCVGKSCATECGVTDGFTGCAK